MISNLTPHALLFTLAAIGISESAYLIRKRRAAETPVCPIGKGCETVLNSKYNRLFLGIHNDLAGMAMYLVLSVLTALLVIMDQSPLWAPLGVAILLAGATLTSVLLVYLQWRVIRVWCFWCLMSAATIGLMDLIVLTAQLS
jgi:uncharacterized membrane protein